MRFAPIARIGVLAAALMLGTVGIAGPAWADPEVPNVPLKDAHLHLLATDATFNHECNDDQGGGPYTDSDVWVFVAESGTFVSLDITFNDGSGTHAVHIPAPPVDYPKGIVSSGSDKAWVKVPAGWTIDSGSADIIWNSPNTVHDTFNVTHTCPATPTPNPCESTVGVPQVQTCPTTTTPVTETPDPCASTPGVPPNPTCTTTTPATTTTSHLPKTGAPVSGFLSAGAILVLAGIGTLLGLFLWRRRSESTE